MIIENQDFEFKSQNLRRLKEKNFYVRQLIIS